MCYRRLTGAVPCPVDRWPPPRRSELAPPPGTAPLCPPEVPGFTAIAPLGAGGFAVVWSAVRADDGAAAAIKVGRAFTPDMVERFRREAATLGLVGPPHVPQLFAAGRLPEGAPYLVMERLAGRTLADALADRMAPMEPGRVEAIADSALAALEVAHARGVVHRDLKPENIFLAEDGRVTLLDFGLVKRPGAGSSLTRPGAAVGTLEYMSPEQIRGDPEVSAQADVYALGAVLFELLTLRTPFVGEDTAIELGHLALRPPRPSAIAKIPAAVEAVVLACLAKDPAQRPRGAAGLRRALADAFAAPRGGRPDHTTSTTSAASADEPHARPLPDAPLPNDPGARVLTEGQVPVVIAVIDSDDAAQALAAVRARGGVLARQRGRRLVVVFAGASTEDPAGTALALAQALTRGRPARAALHVTGVLLRRGPRGAPLVLGAAVDRPEQWLPLEPWSGLWRSSAFTHAARDVDPLAPTQEGTRVPPAPASRRLALRSDDTVSVFPPAPPALLVPAATHDSGAAASASQGSGERRPAPLGELPLEGRDDALAALEASARLALERRTPALTTVLADHGLGKSRLAAEAAALARRLDEGALVVTLRGDAPTSTAPGALVRSLVEALGEAPLLAPTNPGPPRPPLPTRAHALAHALLRRAAHGPVAVILDDAHRASDLLLDALERALTDGAGCPLWVVIAALPRFEPALRRTGQHTAHTRLALAPLEEPAAMRLAAELLRPAERPPDAVLERLARWSAGVPACLVELARALKQAGLVRRRPGRISFHVAAEDLAALPVIPAWQWIAARKLGALPPELAACARVCAVLGAGLTRYELGWVLDELVRAGGAGTPIDAEYGIEALLAEGLLAPLAGERYAFREALLEQAITALLDPAERAALHRHALDYWRQQAAAEGLSPLGEVRAVAPTPEAIEVLDSLARHAAGAGAEEEAASALLLLGNLRRRLRSP